ncbi:MAG: AI-2E family transporter [Bacillota bacterium]
MTNELVAKVKRIAQIILLLLALLLLIYWVGGVFLPFLLAFVLAYLLNPIVKLWEAKGFSRVGGIFLTYFFFITAIILFSCFVLPIFWRQLEVLAMSIPQYTHRLQSFFQNFNDNYKKIAIPNALRNQIDLALLQLELIVIGAIAQVVNGIISVFTHALSIIIAPVLAYYVLRDQKLISERFLSFFPVNWAEKLVKLWREIDVQLNCFIKGHLLVAVLVGIGTSIGFLIINLDFPFLLGLIVGITEIIPYFGPVIGAIPALGIALLDSKIKALYALVLMVTIQQLESNILTPRIIGSRIGLHPLLVILALFLGGKIFGIIGLLLAIPMILILRVFWLQLVIPVWFKKESKVDEG